MLPKCCSPGPYSSNSTHCVTCACTQSGARIPWASRTLQLQHNTLRHRCGHAVFGVHPLGFCSPVALKPHIVSHVRACSVAGAPLRLLELDHPVLVLQLVRQACQRCRLPTLPHCSTVLAWQSDMYRTAERC